MKNRFVISKFLIINILFFLPASMLYSQAICTGSACSSLPIRTQDLNALPFNFKSQYTDIFVKDMMKAGIAANLAGIPAGSALDGKERFTAGLTLPVGYEAKHDLIISSPGVGTFPNATSAGVGISPRLFAGVNLGWALHKANVLKELSSGESSPWYSLERLDVYAGYFKYSYSTGGKFEIDPSKAFQFDPSKALNTSTGAVNTNAAFTMDPAQALKPSNQIKLNYMTRSFEIRYRMLDRRRIGGISWLEMLPTTISTGYYKTSMDLFALNPDSTFDAKLDNGKTMAWKGSAIANYKNWVESVPIEVRSGISLFKHFNLTLGLGFAFNHGRSNLEFTQYGNASIQEKSLFNAGAGGTGANSQLGVRTVSNVSPTARNRIIKTGLEFDFPHFKLIFEGTFTETSEALTIGMRTAF
jgi:hypothetical protein